MLKSMLDFVRYFLTYKNHFIFSALKFVFFTYRYGPLNRLLKRESAIERERRAWMATYLLFEGDWRRISLKDILQQSPSKRRTQAALHVLLSLSIADTRFTHRFSSPYL